MFLSICQGWLDWGCGRDGTRICLGGKNFFEQHWGWHGEGLGWRCQGVVEEEEEDGANGGRGLRVVGGVVQAGTCEWGPGHRLGFD